MSTDAHGYDPVAVVKVVPPGRKLVITPEQTGTQFVLQGAAQIVLPSGDELHAPLNLDFVLGHFVRSTRAAGTISFACADGFAASSSVHLIEGRGEVHNSSHNDDSDCDSDACDSPRITRMLATVADACARDVAAGKCAVGRGLFQFGRCVKYLEVHVRTTCSAGSVLQLRLTGQVSAS